MGVLVLQKYFLHFVQQMMVYMEAFRRLVSWADGDVSTIGVTVAMAVTTSTTTARVRVTVASRIGVTAASRIGVAGANWWFGNDSSCHYQNGNLKKKKKINDQRLT